MHIDVFMNVLYSICMRDSVCIVVCACVYCMSLSVYDVDIR